MASHGKRETEALKLNLQGQLERLLLQLEDLDELRQEIDDDEYDEIKSDTKEQLQAAIADAFQTPEVIRLFAKKEPDALRTRLAAIQQDYKLTRLPFEAFKKQSIEIIVALKKLGETLNAQEKAFLKQHDDALAMFESADQAIDASVVAGAVSGAAAE